MNYIEQINLLHRIRRKDSLEPIAVALHVILLDICNSDDWENPFSLKNDRIISDLDVTFKTLAAARNKLQQSGLIKFKTKNGSPECIYKIHTPDECKQARTFVKIPEVKDEVADEVRDEVTDKVKEKVQPVYTGIIKPKPNQTKKQPSDGKHPPSPKKNLQEEKKPSLYTACMEIYANWFEARFSIGPKIDGQQGKALKNLIAYITNQVKKKPEVTIDDTEVEQRVKNNWQWIFDNWDKLEDFHQKKTKLSEISSNIQNIIIQIKAFEKKENNGQFKGNRTGHNIDAVSTAADAVLLEFANRHGERGNPE